MGRKPFQPRVPSRLAVRALVGILTAAAWGTVGAAAGHAQAQPMRILFSDDPRGAANARPDLTVRPNVTQEFYVFVDNPGNTARKVSVQLLVPGTPPMDPSGPVAVPAGKLTRVDFGKPAPVAAGQPAPVWPELPGPPFAFKAVLRDARGEVLREQTVSLTVLVPSQYVDVAGIQYNGPQNRLSVELRAGRDFTGPPCPVSLVVRPENIPGLLLPPDAGTYRSTVEKDQPADLVAEDLQFKGAGAENGLVYITVDGYNRAFAFKTTFDRQGGVVQPQRVQSGVPSVRLVGPRYTLPVSDYRIGLEVDNAPRADVDLRLGLDRAGNGRFQTVRTFPGVRQQHVRLNPRSPSGAVLFKTEVQDWSAELDLTGILGTRTLRAQMLNPQNGQVIPVRSPLSSRPDSAVEAPVTVDNTPPTGRFVDMPRELPVGKPLPLRAVARDPESDIRRVRFFLGPLTPDGKVPLGTQFVDAKRPPNPDGVWSATLDVLPKSEVVDVTAEFENNVGLKSYAAARVPIVPPAVARVMPPPTTGTIEGVVKNAGDMPQPGRPVVLTDDKGVEKGRTLTNDQGAYVFKDVPPGKYTVTSTNVGAMSVGSTPVTVVAGQVAPGPIKVVLR